MFYLQTANPPSGTDFWVREKVAVLRSNRAKLSLIRLFKKTNQKKNDKKNREIHDCKPPKIGLEV